MKGGSFPGILAGAGSAVIKMAIPLLSFLRRDLSPSETWHDRAKTPEQSGRQRSVSSKLFRLSGT